LNIVPRNSLEDKNTWVLFSDQYLDLVHGRSLF
jgi:hypothetical protein